MYTCVNLEIYRSICAHNLNIPVLITTYYLCYLLIGTGSRIINDSLELLKWLNSESAVKTSVKTGIFLAGGVFEID